MKCLFCNPKQDVKEWDLKKTAHLVITKDINGTIHVHGDLENKPLVRDFIEATRKESKLESDFTVDVVPTGPSTCKFCNNNVPIYEWDSDIVRHIVITQDKERHLHVHGTLDNKDVVHELLTAASDIVGIELEKTTSNIIQPPPKVVFKNRQAIGDILTMTAAVRDFKAAFSTVDVGVLSTAMHIWDHNPHINHQLREEDLIVEIGPGTLTNRSNRDNRHMCNAYRVSMEEKLGIQIPQGNIHPDIWLTKEERDRPPLIDEHYWIIVVSGEPGWPVKMYDRWQEVVDSLPHIKFVQIGLKSQKFTRLQNTKGNIIDYIGKTENKHTGLRDLFNLFLYAQGTVGLVSMHMHLSAAFNNPCVVVAGAREPSWFTQYLGHQYISTNGCLPCAEYSACWKCKVEGCVALQEKHNMVVNTEVPPCIGIIDPYEIINGIEKYYEGQRLNIKERKRITFKNIAKEPKVYVAPSVDNTPAEKYDFTWGGDSVTDKDWIFLQKVIQAYKIKSVLEFGADLSTLLMAEKVDHIVTYETSEEKANRILQYKIEKVDIRPWNGKEIEDELPKFDLGYVDGPPGGPNRENSFRIAAKHSDVILVHDAGREWERKWAEKHLAPDFDMASKGGNRFNLWVRRSKKGSAIIEIKPERGLVTPTQATLNTCPTWKAPDVRIVSTARGGGGQFRSVTQIMRLLTAAGHSIEFVPFHSGYEVGTGIGRDWMTVLNTELKDVVVRDWSAIKEPTGLTLVYTDDYVWEFTKPHVAEAFSDMKSDRRLMFTNYRLGQIGKVPWTQGWDHYGALNSTLITNLEKVYPDCIGKTSVMPPCTDLTPYLDTKPNYEGTLKIVRHSSQGNTKYCKETFNKDLERIHNRRPDAIIRLMPAPDFCIDEEYIIKHKKNQPSVPEFLGLGNLYWYSVPKGYTDSGPRVIVESMASGLGCVSDAKVGGPDDRIIQGETGYLCDTKEEHAEMMKTLTPEKLRDLGEASRQRVIDNWSPDKWVTYLIEN